MGRSRPARQADGIEIPAPVGWSSSRATPCSGNGWPAAAASKVLARKRGGRTTRPSSTGSARSGSRPRTIPTCGRTWSRARPEPVRRVGAVGLDRALAAVEDFSDLRSMWTRGRASRLATATRAAGQACGLPDAEIAILSRAALVADVGAVGVPGGIWERPGPLWRRRRRTRAAHACLSNESSADAPGIAIGRRARRVHHEQLDEIRLSPRRRCTAALRRLGAPTGRRRRPDGAPRGPAASPGTRPAAARDVLWQESPVAGSTGRRSRASCTDAPPPAAYVQRVRQDSPSVRWRSSG